MWRCNREISDNICNDLKVCMIFQRSGSILHQSATFCQDIWATHPVTCYREAAGEMLMVSGDIITPWPLSTSPPPLVVSLLLFTLTLEVFMRPGPADCWPESRHFVQTEFLGKTIIILLSPQGSWLILLHCAINIIRRKIDRHRFQQFPLGHDELVVGCCPWQCPSFFKAKLCI